MTEPESTGLQASRPEIELDGQTSSSLNGGLLDLRVSEDIDGMSTCEASFGNWGPVDGKTDFLFFDRRTVEFGKSFAIKVGPDAIFRGKITGIEGAFPQGGSPTVTVLAEDRFQDLRMTRRTRTFADMSDSAVINQIATDHGLTPDVDVTGPTYKVLAQLNQSDLAFLRDRARSAGAELAEDNGKLTVKPRSSRAGGDPIELAYGKQLREFSVTADLAGQRTSIAVNGWDVAGKAGLTESAADSVVSGEVGSGESGASVLSATIGERKEAVANAVPQTSDEARARAEAMFRRTARRFLTGRGVAETNAKLRVGATLRLSGLGKLFDGDYYLAGVTHLYDGAGGLRSELTVERPGIGRP